MKSHCSFTSRLMPRPSEPTTTAAAPFMSTEHQVSPSISKPYTQTPRFFISRKASVMLDTRATGTYSTAPAEALYTAEVRPALRPFGNHHAVDAAVSAVRRMAPEIVGILQLVADHEKGRLPLGSAATNSSSSVTVSLQAARAAMP